jgi:site-specific recombinase XerD
MNIQSVLKVNKSGKYEYIVIYFKLGNNILRIPTKEIYEKSKVNKDLTFNSKKEDYEKINKKISFIKYNVDRYIRRRLQDFKPSVNQKDCLLWLTEGEYVKENIEKAEKNKTALEWFKTFYDYKLGELGDSANNYHSLYVMLTEFQEANIVLTFEHMNSIEYMSEFKQFLGSVKGQKNNSISKRFSYLKTFFRYIEEKDLYNFKPSVMNYKQEQYSPTIVTLSNAEIKQLKNLQIENIEWSQIRDMFVFNYFTGLRYSDLSTLTPLNFVKDNEGDWMIIQENKKTETVVNIPVHLEALSIAQKYNFQFPFIERPRFNKQLAKLLIKYVLFSDMIIVKKRVLNEVEDYLVMKRKMIKSHTMRRSAITNWFDNNVPLTNLMSASGHTTIASIKSYMDIQQNKTAFKGIKF